MNRLNQKGVDLIQYKAELMKDYPKLVKDSLMLAIEQMLENKVVDLDTYEVIKNQSETVDSFEGYLNTKEMFKKTNEEVFHEFEIIREHLNEKLRSFGLNQLDTESVVTKDLIMVTRKFCIDESFVLDYFGVKEEDIPKLIKRRGFVEKFAVLRLTAIFKPFMQALEYPSDLFKCDMSLVYFDKIPVEKENPNEETKYTHGYSIDLLFELPIEEVENDEKFDSMCEAMKEIVEKTESHYAAKTVA